MFITFEGLDGSGKTTQVRMLAAGLRAEGRDVVETREPGGTALGERVRELLLAGDDIAPWTEAALFAAARAQLVAEVIGPSLAEGRVVICDRYIDSSLAYQGLGRGLGVERVLELNLAAVGGLLPDRTFLLLLSPAEAAERLRAEPDRMERQGDTFASSVDRAYRELAETYAGRIVALDAAQEPETLSSLIREQLRDLA